MGRYRAEAIELFKMRAPSRPPNYADAAYLEQEREWNRQAIDQIERELDAHYAKFEREAQGTYDLQRARLEVGGLPWLPSDFCDIREGLSDGLAVQALKTCTWAPRFHRDTGRYIHVGPLQLARSWFRRVTGDVPMESDVGIFNKAMEPRRLAHDGLINAYQYVMLTQTSSDFPSILADALSKIFRGKFLSLEPIWPLWARKATSKQFSIFSTGVDPLDALGEIAEGAEIKEVPCVGDLGVRYTLRTFGAKATISRRAILNDDLQAISDPGQRLGEAASRLPDDLSMGLLAGNGVAPDGTALFTAAHANFVVGALNIATLDAARAALGAQANATGTRMNLKARLLLVGNDGASAAGQVLDRAGNDQIRPEDRIDLVIDGRIDEIDPGAAFLLSDPARLAAVEVAFLEGRETPEFRSRREFDTQDVKTRILWEVGARVVDHRAAVRICEESGSGSGGAP